MYRKDAGAHRLIPANWGALITSRLAVAREFNKAHEIMRFERPLHIPPTSFSLPSRTIRVLFRSNHRLDPPDNRPTDLKLANAQWICLPHLSSINIFVLYVGVQYILLIWHSIENEKQYQLIITVTHLCRFKNDVPRVYTLARVVILITVWLFMLLIALVIHYSIESIENGGGIEILLNNK